LIVVAIRCDLAVVEAVGCALLLERVCIFEPIVRAE
jgi:hypothetical protein